MTKSTKVPKKIPAKSVSNDEESDGEDIEIDKLVESSIKLVMPPAIQISTEKAFHNLTEKLTKVGSSSQRKLILHEPILPSSIGTYLKKKKITYE